jgi:hypothetical protein
VVVPLLPTPGSVGLFSFWKEDAHLPQCGDLLHPLAVQIYLSNHKLKKLKINRKFRVYSVNFLVISISQLKLNGTLKRSSE